MSQLLIEPQSLRILEGEKTGKVWDVVIIKAGLSKNKTFYPPEVLKEAAPLFENAKLAAYEFDPRLFDHVPGQVRSQVPGGFAKNVVGWLENVRWDESKQALVGRAHITENAKWLRQILKNGFESGNREVLGFSIDAAGQAAFETYQGKPVKKIVAIESVEELTVVTSPSAGGKTIRMVASIPQEDAMVPTEILKALKDFPDSWREGFELDEIDDEKAPDLLVQVIEANLSRANQELAGIKPEEKLFEQVARGVATLQSILKMLAEKKFDEAMAMIQKWIAAYPKPEGSSESSKGIYAFPAASKEGTEPRPPAPEGEPPMTKPTDGDLAAKVAKQDEDLEKLRKETQVSASESKVATALAESKLPEIAKQRVRNLFSGRIATDEQIKEAITNEHDYLSKISAAGALKGFGGRKDDPKVVSDRLDRFQKAMHGMLCGEMEVDGVPAFISLHESYRKITGFGGSNHEIARRIMVSMAASLPAYSDIPSDDEYEKHPERLKESIATYPLVIQEALATTDWAQVFGDSIRRALIKEYQAPPFDVWRRVVSDIVPLPDFRTNRRIRVGGLADLSTVAEAAAYTEFATPADEEATYTATKRGNLWRVSFEAILADDLGKLRQMVRAMGRAAMRTLSKEVIQTNLMDNPVTSYDATALIDGAHANNQAAALSESTLQIAIQQMRKQTELTSGERIWVIPRFLLVPPDLEDTAWELTQSRVKVGATERETVNNAVREHFRIEPLVSPWATDTNDWFLIADPKLFPTIEVGFVGGRQNPEIFVQEAGNLGLVFTNDQVTWKIRHAYGAEPLDHRSFAGSLVV